MRLIRGEAANSFDFYLVLLVGVVAAGVPYGYAIALILGTALYYLLPRREQQTGTDDNKPPAESHTPTASS